MNDDPPGLRVLREELEKLVGACGGMFGAIIDEGNGLWCTAPLIVDGEVLADRFYRAEIAPRAHSMRRGQRLSVRCTHGPERYLAESFAALYVVVLWFEQDFDGESVRARVLEALPKIEALTLALPPFDGPEGGEGVQKARA